MIKILKSHLVYVYSIEILAVWFVENLWLIFYDHHRFYITRTRSHVRY
jgi:hypothetical protein